MADKGQMERVDGESTNDEATNELTEQELESSSGGSGGYVLKFSKGVSRLGNR